MRANTASVHSTSPIINSNKGMPVDKKTSISLVLGSGGARGLAHIGIIHLLKEKNYDIQSISGCSIGALIGGIYAAGKLDDFEKWVRAITKKDIVALMDLSWERGGLVKGDRVINTLINLVGEVTIEELPIPFTAVAANVQNEKEVWINSGRLFDAIRASVSLPLLLTPFNHNGVPLIDGGVLNPVPIAPTFGDNTEMTIAVNLGGPVDTPESGTPDIASPPKEPPPSPLHGKINRFIAGIQQTVTNHIMPNGGAYDIANQAFDAMQSTIARQKLAAYPPDMLIEIPRSACGTLEFDRAAEMIDLGYRKAQKIICS
ncbi:serine protease [Desulfoluna limicola]|uniref:Serine protease n=1 Tax=Desulfoluna limicola TaxID=2810562 RepID=A0ABM7PJW0_9BACT|nr:patatin-like phospholipase family protein [Desulfoluna limicola]BCS97544.1 serine protease [Desulfoluna limicola]